MTSEAIDHIERQVRDLEAQPEAHPYAAKPSDSVRVEGMVIYNDDYLQNMPSDFALILGRFGAFMEVKQLLPEESITMNTNPRLRINFDE